MNNRNYSKISGVIFSIISFFHLLRLLNGWPARIGSFDVPLWVNVIGLLLTGFLAFWAFFLPKN